LSTNLIVGTFTNQTICFARQLNCSSVTNPVNFIGKISSSQRLTLTAKSPLGNFVIRGVPAAAVQDLRGLWTGTRKQNRTNSFEFFELAAVTNNPNSYVVAGNGAGYSYEGYSLLSSKKKIPVALTIQNGTHYKAMRALM